MIFSNFLTVRKGKAVMKAVVYSCAIIMVLSGIALAADLDVIIGYDKPVGISEKELVKNHGGNIKKDFHLINAVSARLPEVEIEKMKKEPGIKYIVADSIFSAAGEYTSSWGVQYIGSQPVHDQSINGTGVKIAVLDTGIDYNHLDLAGNYKGGYDFINNDPDPWDDNCLSYSRTCHGTHVSGIIAAQHNGIGVTGVAPGAGIYAVKVLDAGGFGAASLVISGIEWAVTNNMNIISMSIESDENNTAVLEAVNAAYNSGILLVAAGGNYRSIPGPVKYPAAYESVIAVTAIDQNGQRASFSPIDQKIEVAAPGVNVNSTIQGGYGLLNGTSMAAPYVTGVAALIFSTTFDDVNHDGLRDNRDVREIIRNSAFDAGSPGKDDVYGYGIIDASKALLGISAHASASANSDLSITKSDGVSRIVAGDGKTYTYNIIVKNNGPSDASGVKVFDTWPDGFIRGTVIASQGTCDIAVDFTCDLGTVQKDGTANINVSYTVPDTSIGNFTNRVEVRSTSVDNNPGNNIAEDKNIVEIILNLVIGPVKSNKDAKQVSLLKGDYSIIITNNKLSKVDMNVYENGIFRKDLSSKYQLNKSKVVSFDMIIVSPKLDFVFIPYGDKGSSGTVAIRRSS